MADSASGRDIYMALFLVRHLGSGNRFDGVVHECWSHWRLRTMDLGLSFSEIPLMDLRLLVLSHSFLYYGNLGLLYYPGKVLLWWFVQFYFSSCQEEHKRDIIYYAKLQKSFLVLEGSRESSVSTLDLSHGVHFIYKSCIFLHHFIKVLIMYHLFS